MRIGSAEQGVRPADGGRFPRRLVWLLLGWLALVALPGCGGCPQLWKTKTAEELEKEAEERAKKEKERKKPNFYVGPLVAYPQLSQLPEFEGAAAKVPEGPERSLADQLNCFYKPGHWTSTTLAAKANHFDFLGELEIGVLDREGRPMGLPGMPYTWSGWRSIALPKGQPKLFEGTLYVPPPGDEARVDCAIHVKRGGSRVSDAASAFHHLMRMPAYQYHLIVLARLPERYTYVRGLDSVRSPLDLKEDNTERAYYRVALLDANRQIALPSHALFWTSIAYLIWDEAEPDKLRPDQQLALLDWLHWGGQLIVSGPGSLEALGNSFLADYLPARSLGSRSVDAADLRELSDRWTPPVVGRKLSPAKAWTGVKWQVHPEARALPGTGDLVLERCLGRGRIVTTAFALAGTELTGWPGFDGFFNACLLRRGPREFKRDASSLLVVKWADDPLDDPKQYPLGQHVFDARRVTALRYFSRDVERTYDPPRPPAFAMMLGAPAEMYSGDSTFEEKFGTDTASWSDFNGVANAARQSLQAAARIEIPGPVFVIWVVLGYLVVLVPLNWLVFRLVGRVEWAWAAAPLIAVVCTVMVIRLAQLDIGFARKLTEVSVLEIQGEYPRAHLTRYAAMYSSLSTRYNVRMDDPGAEVQPFPKYNDPKDPNFRMLAGQGYTQLQCLYGKEVMLRGFEVSSNTTELVHAEQMCEVGGGLRLSHAPGGGWQVTNRSSLSIEGASVVHRDRGTLETAWVGRLEPESTVRLRFQPVPPPNEKESAPTPLWQPQRKEAETGRGPRAGRPELGRLLALAEARENLAPGEMRLVGWADGELEGMEVHPSAPQSEHVGLVVGLLRPPRLPDPLPDTRGRAHVDREYQRNFPEEKPKAKP